MTKKVRREDYYDPKVIREKYSPLYDFCSIIPDGLLSKTIKGIPIISTEILADKIKCTICADLIDDNVIVEFIGNGRIYFRKGNKAKTIAFNDVEMSNRSYCFSIFCNTLEESFNITLNY
ncbi:MAG: hypothetical protein U0L92_04100 [Clostridia bacterium]|nr:hypothetical protein [Clostridia bacterium]